jgi:hypothetical protein
MTDLITTVLHQARNKGMISRVDVLTRYLRIKYKLTTSKTVLIRRIKKNYSKN